MSFYLPPDILESLPPEAAKEMRRFRRRLLVLEFLTWIPPFVSGFAFGAVFMMWKLGQ